MSKKPTKSKVDPDVFMPLYIKDYLADTQRLSIEAHGCYLLLIMDYWMNGRLDDDDEQFCRILRISREKWGKIKPKIASFFVHTEGQWLHPRIEHELMVARTAILDAKLRTAEATAARIRNREAEKQERNVQRNV